MSLEQQIASLNDNVGNLISASERLSGRVESKLQEYENWKGTLVKPNPIVLKVGIDKEFRHPVDAAARITNSAFVGDVFWKIEIDPGIYDFPYKGTHELCFSFFKNVHINGLTSNPGDTIFRYVGDEHHYMIIAHKNSYIEVRNIAFKGIIPITPSFITQINNRSLRWGMPGAGLAHGILARYNSSAYIENCSFNRIWIAGHCHDNSKLDIRNVIGTELNGGFFAVSNSRIEINRSSLSGIGASSPTSWMGLASFHCSSIFAFGVTCSAFNVGLYSHWNGDFHFHKAIDFAEDGVTEINIRNGLIENCWHGVHAWHNAVGNINNCLIRGSQSHAILCGQTSNVHASSNVTVDGADIGFFAIHSSALVANDSIARNCRGIAYHSAHKSEVHAANTSRNLSGNAVNYSPGSSHALGNTDSLLYFS